MNGRGMIKNPVGCRCHYILKRCMAVHLQKQSVVRCVPQQAEASPYWMYDNGYLIFQVSTRARVIPSFMIIFNFYRLKFKLLTFPRINYKNRRSAVSERLSTERLRYAFYVQFRRSILQNRSPSVQMIENPRKQDGPVRSFRQFRVR